MRALGIVWTGVQTDRFEVMSAFMEGLIYELTYDPDHERRATSG